MAALNDISESNRQIAELLKLFSQIHDGNIPDEERVFKLSKDAAKNVGTKKRVNIDS